jgi:L-alanine-DL-glutamate epimerase-like enolase superfamily enzyme
MTDRRRFIKTLGGLAAGSALINPTEIFASSSDSRKKSVSKGDRFTLEWENFTGELKYTFAISSSARNTTPIVLTRLHWGGLVGYGEASLPPYLGETQASVNEFLKKVQTNVLPKFNDPFRIEEILTEIDAIAINNTAAKAAVDIALHDLVGKIMEQPWWKIWGFRPEDTPYTSYTIGWDASDEIVKEKTHEASWSKVLKVKLGRGDYEDRRMIRIIRENNPDTPMYIDANQGWKDKVYALDFIHWLKEQGITMIEQPMNKYDLDSHAWLTERSPLPIIADESCQRLVDIPKLKGAFHGINIKLMKCTGMREAREMVSLANALNLRLMIGCMTETSVAVSAAAQLAPKMEWADLDGNILLSNDCFTGMKLTEGKINLNNLPGIGVKPLSPNHQ